MKYEIHVNQKAIMDNHFDIDLVDGAIMDFCRFFSASPSCRFIYENGKRYYWFSHKIICDQLPILRLKPDSAYRRMKALCEKSFMEAHTENRKLNASWYTFGPNADLLVSTIGSKSDGSEINPKVKAKSVGLESEPSEQNPYPIGSKSEGPSDQNPMYKDIIDKESNNKDTTVAPAPADADKIEVLGIGEITIKTVALYVSDIPDTVRVKFLKENNGRQFPHVTELAKSMRSMRDADKPKTGIMTRPTLEEITAYMTEKKLPTYEAERFFNYHESKGWVVGNKPMQKWKAALATWLNSPFRQPAPKVEPARTAASNNQTYQDLLKPEFRNAH